MITSTKGDRMSIDKKPELNLNTVKIAQMQQRIYQLKDACNSSFNGNMNWRDKRSYKLQCQTMEKALAQEIRAVTLKYLEDLITYEKEQQELKIAEKKFEDIVPIESLSLSSSILEEDEQLQFVNPISEIEI